MRSTLLLLLFLGFSRSCLAIDPSKLLLATIIDPNVDRIIRDSKLLFQSIRLFGGTLNNATLLACVIVENDKPFYNDDLIKFYIEMGVVVDFVSRVPYPLPGTMNKFSAFYRFDSSKFDYFLWLDADIVVFEDPLPLIRLNYHKGAISCVPEMYNYMIRFPLLNESHLFWNPTLPHFILADDELVAPHGHCNTGVLFFDSISMPIFLASLHHDYIKEVMQIYTTDRFLDSLCFVGIVNLAEIKVEPLDYALNYMAFLENDIERLQLTSHDPIFAHFIANSTLECYLPPNEVTVNHCTCLYFNDESVSNDSKIVKRIKQFLLPLDNCLIFAGITLLPTKYPSSKSLNSVFSNFDKVCHLNIIYPSPDMMIFYEFAATVSVILQMEECSEVVALPVSIRNEETKQLLFSEQIRVSGVSSELFTFHFSIPEDMKKPNGHTLVDLTISGDRISLILVDRSKLQKSFRIYSQNYLVSELPITLHSLLFLPEYLALRRLTKRGLVFCCETNAGIEVVDRLIRNWGRNQLVGSRGFIDISPILIIAISTVPRDSDITIEMLASHFSILCRNFSSARCVISLNNHNILINHRDSKVLSFYRSQFLDFIYQDVLDPISDPLTDLFCWYGALTPGGILIGSRYSHSLMVQTFHQKYKSYFNFHKVVIQSAAVDVFGYLQKTSPLHTSFDNFYFSNVSGTLPFPAWYFIKQDR